MEKSVSSVIRQIIGRYEKEDGAVLLTLQALQDEFGYLPLQALPLVAEAFNVSRAEVYGVATFYHDFHFEPHGAHILKLCRAEACQAVGGEALAERAKGRLGLDWGQTSKDGRVTLEQTFCLGLCSCGPSAMVDGKIVGRLTSKRLDEILAEVTS